MDEKEKDMGQILLKNQDDFSTMARRGYKKHGRGAIFIWPSEDKGGLTTYRASYTPTEDPAFQISGAHPKEMAGEYVPETEFVAIFVGDEDEIHAARVALAEEPPLH
jgi:hypothetical protein